MISLSLVDSLMIYCRSWDCVLLVPGALRGELRTVSSFIEMLSIFYENDKVGGS